VVSDGEGVADSEANKKAIRFEVYWSRVDGMTRDRKCVPEIKKMSEIVKRKPYLDEANNEDECEKNNELF
jgi:hypothetical protein